MSTRRVPMICVILCVCAYSFAASPATAPSADLADLREREQEVRGRLREVEQQLIRLSEQSAPAATTLPSQSAEARQRRSVALNDLKAKYQFRKDELNRELRERGARLSIDGVSGISGRMGTKELELQELLKIQFDASRNLVDAKAALEAATAQTARGETLPSVRREVDQDPTVQLIRQAVAEAQKNALQLSGDPLAVAKKNLAEQQKRLDDAMAEVRARATSSMIDALRRQKDAAEAQVKALSEKVDAAKADLGELTDATNKYLAVKDDEQTVRDMLRKVDAQLEELHLAAQTEENAEQARERAQNDLLARIQPLANLKRKYQLQLDDLRTQIKQAEADQTAGMFAGTVDVYLSQEDVHNKSPSIVGATYAGTSEIGGRTFVKLTNSAGAWSVDPSKIVAVRASEK